jgi:hypothetical protein
LSKIFENINKLKLGEGNKSNQIKCIISAEGENMELKGQVKFAMEDNIEK